MMSAEDKSLNEYISENLHLPEDNDYFSDDSAFKSALEEIQKRGWEKQFLEEASRQYYQQTGKHIEYESIEKFRKSGNKRERKIAVIINFLSKIKED